MAYHVTALQAGFLPLSYVPILYTVVAAAGLASCLAIGYAWHFDRLVENGCHVAEFWPSISSTIGDFLPERAVWRTFLVIMGVFFLWSMFLLRRVYKLRLGFWHGRLRAELAGADLASPSPDVDLAASSAVPVPAALTPQANESTHAPNSTFVTSHLGRALSNFFVPWDQVDMGDLHAATTLLRGACAAGWTYVSSSEKLDFHMTAFAVFAIVGLLQHSFSAIMGRRIQQHQAAYAAQHAARVTAPAAMAVANTQAALAWKSKAFCVAGQILALLWMVKWFTNEHARCVPGAYSLVALGEWTFSALDLVLDGTGYYDVAALENFVTAFAPVAGDVSQPRPGHAEPPLVWTGTAPTFSRFAHARATITRISPLPLLLHAFGGTPSFVAAAHAIAGRASAATAEEAVTLRLPPAILWLTEISIGWLFAIAYIQALQQLYFMPMVAMSFTTECASVLSPLLIAAMLTTKRFTTFFVPAAGQTANRMWYIFAVAALGLCQIFVHKNPGHKTAFAWIVPSLLALAMRMRGVYLTQRVAAVDALAGVSAATPTRVLDASQIEATLRALRADVQGSCSRALYGVPLGVCLGLAVRFFFLSVEPLYTYPLFGVLGLWGYILGAVPMLALEDALVAFRMNAVAMSTDSPAASTALQLHFAVSGVGAGAARGFGWAAPTAAAIASGSLLFLTQQYATGPTALARLVAIDPMDGVSSFLVFAAVLAGVVMAPRAMSVYSSASTLARRLHFRQVVVAMIAAGPVVLYYGTRQSLKATPKVAGGIDEWYYPPQWSQGSAWFAFSGGLALLFGLGVAWPTVAAAFWGIPMAAFESEQEGAASPSGMVEVVTGKGLPVGAREAVSYLINIGTITAMVYTVCFPFVPYGELLRDRYHFPLFGVCWALAASLRSIWDRQERATVRGTDGDASVVNPRAVRVAARALLALFMFFWIFRVVLAPEANGRTDPYFREEDEWWPLKGVPEHMVPGARRSIEVEAVAPDYTERRFGTRRYVPTLDHVGGMQQARVKAGIWTIHYAWDNFGVDTFERLTEMVASQDLSIVGLLESDLSRITTGNRDIVEYMSYKLGFKYTDFGPTTLDSTFGCSVISRFPLKNIKRWVPPAPMGEFACVLEAEVVVPPAGALDTRPESERTLRVVVGHNGNTPHIQDLVLQSQVIGEAAERAAALNQPAIFIGYVVTRTSEENYFRMVRPETPAMDAHAMRRSTKELIFDGGYGDVDRTGIPLPKVPVYTPTNDGRNRFRDAGRDHLLSRGRPHLRSPRAESPAWATDPSLINATAASGAEPRSYWEAMLQPETPYAFAEYLKSFRALLPAASEGSPSLADLPPAALRDALQAAADDIWGNLAVALTVIDENPLKLPSPTAADFNTLPRAARTFLDRQWLVADVAEMHHRYVRTRYFAPVGRPPRIATTHPRFEYEHRYCEYIFYRDAMLLDWYKMPEMDLSDTELQIISIAF